MKICKIGDFRHISGIFGIFSKIGLGHVLSIVNMHLCAKNQKNLMIKSRENTKKTVFQHISSIFDRKNGIFPAFLAGKIFFSKIGLRHISDIIILRQCAKFHKKISSTARDIQEILFFRRKSAISAIFRQASPSTFTIR